MIQPLKDQSIT